MGIVFITAIANSVGSGTPEASFFFVDPLFQRGESEVLRLEKILSATIEEGGAPAEFFLARGLCRTQLGRWDDANADFDEVSDLDGKLEPLAEIARSRVLIRNGRLAEGQKLLSQGIKKAKNDPSAQLLAAGAQSDQGKIALAIASLRRIPLSNADPWVVHLTLAWLMAAAPTAKDTKKGVPHPSLVHAQNAVAFSGERDWLSLGALAAAHARGHDFELATSVMERAKAIAPKDRQAIVVAWANEIAAGRPVVINCFNNADGAPE